MIWQRFEPFLFSAAKSPQLEKKKNCPFWTFFLPHHFVKNANNPCQKQLLGVKIVSSMIVILVRNSEF